MLKANSYKILCAVLVGVLCLVIGVYAVIFTSTFRQYNHLNQQQDRYQSQVTKLSKQISQREAYLQRIIQDPEFVDHVVRERLGYSKPGEIIFRFEDEF